jgi:phosphoadenosine phosphosulfate reductase
MSIVRNLEVPAVTDFDLESANAEHAAITAPERLLSADETFGDGMYALASFGTQASLSLDHLDRLGLRTPVIFLDTGFYPQETYDFKAGALSRFLKNRELLEYGPPQSVIEYVKDEELWRHNKPLYDWAIKERYLELAVQELGATALVTGVHRDQTKNREDMEPLGVSKDGQVMVRAFVDWTDEKVYRYIEDNGLPTHPLYPGRKWVGDVHFMNGEKTECGIHLNENGKFVPGMDPKIVRSIVSRLVELDPEAPISMVA